VSDEGPPERPRRPGSFLPGQSGNPGGKPLGLPSFNAALRRELKKTDRRNKQHIEKIAEKVVAMAMRGDMDAVRWVSDRVDGKVAQNLNVNNEQTVHVVPWLPAIHSAVEDQVEQVEEFPHLVDLSVDEVEVVEEGEDDDGQRPPGPAD
jgi:hypothetical protein